jgi:type II secretion system protein H
MRASASQRGFTLVELMIVVIIIGITSAVMFAEMRGTFEDTLLRGVARKMIDACDAASNRAIATHRTYLLKIDSKGGRFMIAPRGGNSVDESGIDLAGAAGELDTRITLIVREPRQAQSDEELPVIYDREQQTSADVISFFADGTCDSREFLLRDRDGVELIVRLNPITSRVRVIQAASK